MTFMVKFKRGEAPNLCAEGDLRVRYREVNRPVRDLGFATVVEHDRWDKTHLRIDTTHAVEACGLRASSGRGAIVAATAAGVKTALRRTRPGDQAAIDSVDTEILRLQDLISECRQRRREAVTKAWTNGHVVRLADTLALIDRVTAGR